MSLIALTLSCSGVETVDLAEGSFTSEEREGIVEWMDYIDRRVLALVVPGMTKLEVLRLAGAPRERNGDNWLYGVVWVHFHGDHVAYVA
jgi:hypothetical protein